MPKIASIVGKRYGHLVVLEEAKGYAKNHNFKNTFTYWRCECDCGNTDYYANTNNLNRGKATKCSECSKTAVDLTGKTFYNLTVLKQNKTYRKNNNIKNTHAYWDCRCICGNIVTVKSSDLQSGLIKQCEFCARHNKRSLGERKIEQILTDNNIPFKTEIIFKDLKNSQNKYYRYDFGIYQNNFLIRLIEFDGEQHYRPVDIFGGEEKFIYTQNNDKIKNQYALEKNIPLVRIPYMAYDSITLEDIMGDKYLLKNI